MRSLLVRIFVSFWSIILITIIVAAAIGYSYAERTRISMQNFEVSDAMLEASASLRDNGRQGLIEWLRALPKVPESLIYVIDDEGRDLLDRPLPRVIRMSMSRFGEPGMRPPRERREPPNMRPARPFTQLIGPDRRVYTIFVMPPQSVTSQWIADRGRPGLIILALLISAAVSFVLARTISRPIMRLRESANALAEGKLDTRAADGANPRRDELGLLTRDFDRMAEQLQRAWQKQSELTGNVSHELRSPLARLRVALELVRRRTGELAELDRIELESERLDELIGRLLEFSRLDQEPEQARSRVDLDALLQSVVEDVCYEYGAPGDDETVRLQIEAPCAVDGYPNALRSAIENVLRNAMQHNGGDGDVLLRLATSHGHAIITIADYGGGVADDELERIFDPFYRSAATRADHPGRSGGLGLAIAARAIALHSGSIKARNVDGGLSIEIRLPLARSRAKP